MTDAGKRLEQISDVGDKVGESIGTITRFIAKNALYFIIVTTLGGLVFLSSMVYSAWKKKK